LQAPEFINADEAILKINRSMRSPPPYSHASPFKKKKRILKKTQSVEPTYAASIGMQTDTNNELNMYSPLRLMVNTGTQEDELEELCESEDEYLNETQREKKIFDGL
jgi:hypothetical protein